MRTIGAVLAACTDEVSSRRALEIFVAKNPQGKPVSGVVCCGLAFKACTVRW